ncbi:MAG: hypothetical protein J3K34DRAFT_488188 [Monoraphidium minutum]|nr:MAG: hypothetical protein J3K34DRAFT_488188 [Monoraphidium minutum]
MGDPGAAQVLLPSWTASVLKSDYKDADEVAQALRSQPLLHVDAQDAGQTGKGAASKGSVVGEFLDAVSQAVAKESGDDLAAALRLFAAAVDGCDAPTLLHRLPAWAPLLSDALRRAVGKPPADGGGAAAEAPAAAAAAAAAGAALFRRLQPLMELPGVRREASAGLSRTYALLPPLLKAGPGPLATEASGLLLALLEAAPASARHHHAALAAELPRLMVAASAAAAAPDAAAAAAGASSLRAAARCLAALPRAGGEAAAWSEGARALLASCHEVLDFMCLGLEGPPFDAAARPALAPPGAPASTHPQAPQQQAHGGAVAAYPWETSAPGGGKAGAQRAAGALLGGLLAGLEAAVTGGFPVAVPLPSGQLLALSARLVSLDAGAAVAAGAVPPSASRLAELLLQQPALHVAGWRLLTLLLGAAGGAQLLPLLRGAARLVGGALRAVRLGGGAALAAAPPAGRQALYEAAAGVVAAGGLAAARSLAFDVLGASLVELYGASPLSAAAGAAAAAAGAGRGGGGGGGGGERPHKRARGGAGGDLGAFDPAAALAAAAAGGAAPRLAASSATDLAAQSAALALLGALLSAGGAALPPELRAHADSVAFHVARSASAAAARLSRDPAAGGGGAAAPRGVRRLQAAAYGALLASLLAPLAGRHPYLAPGLELLAAGRADACPALRALCGGAAAALEALLRPAAAPLAGVRRYAGAGELPPLARPRMWSAVDAELAAAAPAPQQPKAAAPAAAGAAAAAAPAPAAPAVPAAAAAAPAAFVADESSDSEGSLPGIDSGSGGESDGGDGGGA